MTLEISEVVSVDNETVEALRRLMPQLSSGAPPDSSSLEAIAATPSTHLFLARVDAEIVGTLTLAFYRTPTGIKAWIEDVVVDEAARGHGVGAELVATALATARAAGARSVDLTSRPDREAANRLYLHLGFDLRKTNVYRYDLV